MARRIKLALAGALLVAAGPAFAAELPTDPAARAVSLYDQERYAEARAVLEQLDADGKATGPLLYRLAFCLRSAGDSNGEKEVLARAVTALEFEVEFATSLEPAFYLANAYRNQGRSDEMAKVAAAATARLESGELRLEDDPLECFRAGKLYADQRARDKAVEWYAKAVEGFTASPGSYPAYAKWARRYLGDAEYSRGRFEAAEGHYRALIEADGRQVDWDRLAVTLARQRRWAEAREAWGGAAKANPADANRARYAGHLAAAAAKLDPLPEETPSGEPLRSLTKEDLEALMTAQAERVKEIRQQATTESDAGARQALASEVAAIRKVFVAACMEYTLRNLPIRETAFFGGYAGMIFKESAWALPAATARDPNAEAKPEG